MGLSLRGATSGAIDINAPAVAGDNTITLPPSNGGANQFFKNSGTAGIVTYSSMVETSTGLVGIGYSNPSAQFTVGKADGTRVVEIQGDDGVIRGFNRDTGDFAQIDFEASGYTFDCYAVERVGITSAGLVGINQNTPTAFLHTKSGANDGTVISTFEGATNNKLDVKFIASGPAINVTAGDPLVFEFSGTEKLRITSAGAITATGNFTTGGSIISEANPEASDTTNGAMLDKVKVVVRNAAGQSVWLGYKNGTSGATSSINVDGDTTIRDLTARTVTSSDQVISNRSGTSVCFRAQDGGTDNFTVKASGALDANGRADIGTNSLDDYAVAGFSSSATYGGIYAQNNNANGYLFTGQENSTEVFKVYANGRINSGNPYASGNGVNIFGGGSIYIRQDGSTGGVLRIRNGSDYKIELKGNGDADFAGAVKIGGTAAANQMDEYEEGTWTPVFYFGGAASGAVFAMQEGHYVKIGRQVIAQFRIELTNKGSSTGSMTISTPFAVLNTFTSTGIDGNALVGYTGGMSSTQVGSAPVSGYCEGGTSLAYFTARLSSGNAATLNQTDVENNFSIAGTMFFYAA